ncbi:MAG TPA: DoxX family protein [Devosiaceae bacterium]|nr:DoxX family protein [Devosiaceae bacterium]
MGYHELVLLVGRVLIGGVFVWGGIDHFWHFRPPLMIMKARGVPYAAAVLVIGSLWELVLGALVLAGLWIVPASLGLVVFTVIATIIMHNFWDHSGKERVEHTHVVLGNTMVVGGLLVLAASVTSI